jgi:carbonic anhydrase/acetyltransferase-like protein (isoleucine patch superfamily)
MDGKSEEPTIRAGVVDVSFGKRVTVISPVNLYGCVIGEGCFIGPFVEIQRGVVIGKGCRITISRFHL